MTTPPPKSCASCGRTITWRRKWAQDWEEVRYCSSACRRAGVTLVDRALEQAILALLAQRPAGATICPSEVARGTTDPANGEAWRAKMEPVRRAARRLVAEGRLEITQKGQVVDASTAKGAIRLRLPR